MHNDVLFLQAMLLCKRIFMGPATVVYYYYGIAVERQTQHRLQGCFTRWKTWIRYHMMSQMQKP